MKLIAAALAASLGLAFATPSFAGECPADKVGVDVMPKGPDAPSKVTDTVIGEIDLSGQYAVEGRKFRMRRLEVQPGGVVPTHAHGERPAHIYVLKGQITEYRSTCSVPILHKAGDLASEAGDLSHWWRNDTKKPAILLSADILPPAGGPEESM